MSGLAGTAPSEQLSFITKNRPADTAKETLLFDGGVKPYSGVSKLTSAADTSPDALRLHAPIKQAGADTPLGSIAWLVTDENQKARVDLRAFKGALTGGTPPSEHDYACWMAAAASRNHPGYAADHLGDWIAESDSPDTYVASWSTLPLDRQKLSGGKTWFPDTAVTPEAKALRHDFTTGNISLLTDTLSGGLKRDISTLAVQTDTDFAKTAARFSSEGAGDALGYVGLDTERNDWFNSPDAPAALGGLFDFSSQDKQIWPTWFDLRQWAKFSNSDKLDANSGSPMLPGATYAESQTAFGATASGDAKTLLPWRQPVLARFRFEISVFTPNDPATARNVNIAYKLNAVAQIWNPFNVRLKMPGGNFWIRTRGVPLAVRWYSAGTGGNGQIPARFGMGVPLSGPDMEPGEIRTFSLPVGSSDLQNDVVMTPGYSPSGGYVSTVQVGVSAKATDLTYAVGRLTNPSEVAGASPLSSSGPSPRDGVLEFYHTDSGNASANLVGTLGDQNNKWLQLPAGYTTTARPLPPLTQLFTTPFLCGVFEYRLKSEKSPVTPGGRFTPPPLLNQSGWSYSASTAASAADWNACPYELVGWDPNLFSDPEKYGAQGDFQVAPAENGQTRGFFFTGNTPSTGISHAVRYRVPLHPPVSLAELRHARLTEGLRPLVASNRNFYANAFATTDAFSNSLAHPFVSRANVFETTGTAGRLAGSANLADYAGPAQGLRAVDHSWVLNTALADTWFASSLGDWRTGASGALFSSGKDYPTLLRDVFVKNTEALPNRRLQAVSTPDAVENWSTDSAASPNAWREIARSLVVQGGFNINSTSVRAWRAFLASTRETATVSVDSTGKIGAAVTSAGIPAARTADMPNDALATTAQAESSPTKRVNGGRELSDDELDSLAVAMVAEVKKRGPFLSLGEFLNRRIEDADTGDMGAVQAAIEAAKLNAHRTTTGAATGASLATTNASAAKTYDTSGVGARGWLSQGDLVAPLLSAMTPRGDTFVIRARGESEDGAVAYCELTVRRSYDFLDGNKVDAEWNPPAASSAPKMTTSNKVFGRRFTLVTRTWLQPDQL